MSEKKVITAVVELGTALIVLYAQDKDARAKVYLTTCKVSRWAAEKLGRLALAAEVKYRNEVSP